MLLDHSAGAALAAEVEKHRRRLRRLGLRPADLVADVGVSEALAWAARRGLLLPTTAATVALAGFLLYWVPYRLTGLLIDRLHIGEVERSTWKLLVGMVIYTVWTFGLSIAAGLAFGIAFGLALLIVMPVVGMAGLVVRERWRGARDDARRFLRLRTRRPLIDAMRDRQRELGERLDALHRRFTPGNSS